MLGFAAAEFPAEDFGSLAFASLELDAAAFPVVELVV